MLQLVNRGGSEPYTNSECDKRDSGIESTDQASYTSGTVVTLTPSAAVGLSLCELEWRCPERARDGQSVIGDDECQTRTLQQTLRLHTYTLTVSATNGTVALNPPTGPYNYGTSVTLTPSAAEGYTFELEWRCPERTRDGQSVIGDDECQ